jgi:hypothetical protein
MAAERLGSNVALHISATAAQLDVEQLLDKPAGEVDSEDPHITTWQWRRWATGGSRQCTRWPNTPAVIERK